MGTVATNLWVTRIKAPVVTQTGKTNAVGCFVIVLVGCRTESRPESVFILTEKGYFLSFKRWKSGKFILPTFWCWFNDDLISKLSKTFVLYVSSSEIISRNYFFPLRWEGYQCHHTNTSAVKGKTVSHFFFREHSPVHYLKRLQVKKRADLPGAREEPAAELALHKLVNLLASFSTSTTWHYRATPRSSLMPGKQ